MQVLLESPFIGDLTAVDLFLDVFNKAEIAFFGTLSGRLGTHLLAFLAPQVELLRDFEKLYDPGLLSLVVVVLGDLLLLQDLSGVVVESTRVDCFVHQAPVRYQLCGD